jgi:hypothetical protein
MVLSENIRKPGIKTPYLGSGLKSAEQTIKASVPHCYTIDSPSASVCDENDGPV